MRSSTEPTTSSTPSSTPPAQHGRLARSWRDRSTSQACGQLLHRLTDQAGFVPDLRFVTEDLAATLRFVASGVAVAVLPRLALGQLPEGLTLHQLPDIERHVTAYVRTAAQRRPTLAVVLDELRLAGRDRSARAGVVTV